MATPVFTSIIEQINTDIAAMSISGGYSFDYGTVNEYDPASREYPATFTNYPSEVSTADQVTEHTMKTADINFMVRIGSSSDIDEDLNKVLGDFDELFENNFSTYNGLGLLDYEYVGSTRTYRLVENRPADIDIVYRLKYRWKKNNPYST